jgi:hypothetical protein
VDNPALSGPYLRQSPARPGTLEDNRPPCAPLRATTRAGAGKPPGHRVEGESIAMPLLPFLPTTASLTALQRVLLVALLTPVIAALAISSLPALMVLPFLPGGTDRTTRLLRAHRAYLNTLLIDSRSSP